MIAALYKFVALSDEIKAQNKIRSEARLDCISVSDTTSGGYKGLTNFVNTKRFNGQLYLYKTPPTDFVNADSKRIAEWALTNSIQKQTINFSSIYIEDLACPEIGFGYPNPNRLLKNGSPNPLFPFRNDGFLFIINKDYTEIEILIIPDGRNLISSYYQIMIDGGFENEIRELRANTKPYYKYEGLSYSKLFSLT